MILLSYIILRLWEKLEHGQFFICSSELIALVSFSYQRYVNHVWLIQIDEAIFNQFWYKIFLVWEMGLKFIQVKGYTHFLEDMIWK